MYCHMFVYKFICMKNQVLIVATLLILSSVAALVQPESLNEPYETGYIPGPLEIYFPCFRMFWDNITCL